MKIRTLSDYTKKLAKENLILDEQFLSEEDLSILVESRIDFVKNQFSNLSSDHDALATHTTPSDIVDHFADKADPTKNKQYTQYVVNQYHKQKIRQEDAPRIKEALTHFDRYKSKLPMKDINSYKDISDIEAAVHPHIGTASTNAEKKVEIDTGREKIHDENGTQVYHLKTKEASQLHYGGGHAAGKPSWCTAAKSGNCMFDRYHNTGNLYTIHTKGDDNTGMHQIHFNKDNGYIQLMDHKDAAVEPSVLVAKHPELKNVPQFKEHGISSLPFMSKEESGDTVTKEMAKPYNEDNTMKMYRSGHGTPEQRNDMIDGVISSAKGVGSTADLFDSSHTTPEHRDKIIDHISKNIGPHESYYTNNLATSKHLTPAHIATLYNTKHPAIKESIVKSPATSPDTLSKHFTDRPSKHISDIAVLTHPNVSHDVLRGAMNNIAHHGAITANKKTPSDVLSHIASTTTHSHVLENIAKHKNSSKEVLQNIADNAYAQPEVKELATKSLSKKK